MERPRARKRLSSTEVALIDYLVASGRDAGARLDPRAARGCTRPPCKPTSTRSGTARASIDWLSDNRDGLLVGALVAAGIVALMLVMRRDRRAHPRAQSRLHQLARDHRLGAGQDQIVLHGRGGGRDRRHLRADPAAHRPRRPHPLHHRRRAPGRDLGARADHRRGQAAGSARTRANRRSAMRCRSSACWSASPLFAIALDRHPRQSRASTSPP